jgi:Ca2+-transporting ATPase
LGFAKLWFVFNLRDRGSGVVDNEIVKNRWIWASTALCTALLLGAAYAPGLSQVLETRPLGLQGLALALAVSLVPALVGQSVRLFRRQR